MIEILLGLLVLIQFLRLTVEAHSARAKLRVMRDSEEQTELLRQHTAQQEMVIAEHAKREAQREAQH